MTLFFFVIVFPALLFIYAASRQNEEDELSGCFPALVLAIVCSILFFLYKIAVPA